MILDPLTRPAMLFLGVTTARSSMMRVFPRWAEALGLGDCELRGIDFRLHDDPARYRETVDLIKRDPLALGALVTTHKLDLFAAAGDRFDRIEPRSRSLGEISSIYKRDGLLHGRAVEPWSVGLALEAFLPPGHWRDTGAEVLVLGAGGSAVALAWHLSQPSHARNRPTRVHVVSRSTPRLDHLRRLHASWPDPAPLTCHHLTRPEECDDLVAALPPHSLVVNATGLGKDAPGSPLTSAAVFPEAGLAWEFNYRGDLVFLDQARAQQASRRLTIEDGWVFFLHGWTRVISDVFNVPIPSSGPRFEELASLAREARSAPPPRNERPQT